MVINVYNQKPFLLWAKYTEVQLSRNTVFLKGSNLVKVENTLILERTLIRTCICKYITLLIILVYMAAQTAVKRIKHKQHFSVPPDLFC